MTFIEKVEECIKDGILDLDLEVHDLKSVEATEINNAGIEAQIEYIEDRCGKTYLRKLIS